MADVLVLDGVTQTAPERAALALLAVDRVEPWGRAGAVPPWGDLRAPVADLLHLVDEVVAAPVVAAGARQGAALLTWEMLRPLRVGLFCALARPERVLRSLSREGVVPAVVVRARDHGPGPSASGIHPPSGTRVDLWLVTPKCAQHVAKYAWLQPFAVLEHSVELPVTVVAALTGVSQGNNVGNEQKRFAN
jgi:hypothetical protein